MTQSITSLKSVVAAKVDWLSLSVIGAFSVLLLSDKVHPVAIYFLQLYLSL